MESTLPGPRGLPLLGVAPSLLRDSLGFLEATRARYGDVTQFRIGARTLYFVSDADAISIALKSYERTRVVGVFTEAVRTVFGEGLFGSRGDLWQGQRRALQPLFRRSQIDHVPRAAVDATEAAIDRFVAPGESVCINERDLTDGLIIRILLRTLFDDRGGSVDEAQLSRTLGSVDHNLFLELLTQRLRLPRLPRMRKAVAELDAAADTIASQLAMPSAKGATCPFADVQSWSTEGRPGFAGKYLRELIKSFLFAGQTTSCNAIAWAVIQMAERADVQTIVRSEAEASLQDAAADPSTLLDDLEMAAAVVHETLRLLPPVYVLTPVSTGELAAELGIPAGAPMVASQWVMHRHPDHWSNPTEFEPQRFLADQTLARPSGFYFPFGLGPKLCIGSQIAVSVLTTIVATLFKECEIAPTWRARPSPRASSTLWPSEPIEVRVTRRPAASLRTSSEAARTLHAPTEARQTAK